MQKYICIFIQFLLPKNLLSHMVKHWILCISFLFNFLVSKIINCSFEKRFKKLKFCSMLNYVCLF